MASTDKPGSRGAGSRHGSRGSRQHVAQSGGGDMSVREAGRMGGEARKERLGPAGYSRLGPLGGQCVRELELVEQGRQADGGAGRGDRSR